ASGLVRFFLQAEDGIRGATVTGVQTCALPIYLVVASLMVESKRESWHEMVRRAEDAGSDALELNFGCPHGMSERGMGSAVGQVRSEERRGGKECRSRARW